MGDFLSILLHSRTQAHVFHLRVSPNAYAMHIALEEYYTNIIDIIDSIAEAYQGMTGIIEYKSVKSINNNADAETIIAYFNNLLKFVKTERKSKELSHSWIQNEIDNIEKLIYKIIYKLENL